MQSVNAMFIIHSYTAQQESWRHAWAAVKLKSANKNGFFFFSFQKPTSSVEEVYGAGYKPA